MRPIKKAIAAFIVSSSVLVSFSANAERSDPYILRQCDASACFVYWNVGTLTKPNYILIAVEPKPQGGRQAD
jgi:hypothetical protein